MRLWLWLPALLLPKSPYLPQNTAPPSLRTLAACDAIARPRSPATYGHHDASMCAGKARPPSSRTLEQKHNPWAGFHLGASRPPEVLAVAGGWADRRPGNAEHEQQGRGPTVCPIWQLTRRCGLSVRACASRKKEGCCGSARQGEPCVYDDVPDPSLARGPTSRALCRIIITKIVDRARHGTRLPHPAIFISASLHVLVHIHIHRAAIACTPASTFVMKKTKRSFRGIGYASVCPKG